MSSWRLAVVLGFLPVCVAACASAIPPSSPRDISSREAMGIFMEAAQRPCADLARAHANQTIAADLMVAGASHGSRVSTRLWLGWDLDAGSLRLEPFQGSPPAFVFIANGLTDDNYDPDQLDGSLILPDRSGAIQQEFSRELLYPLLGVPLSADELIGGDGRLYGVQGIVERSHAWARHGAAALRWRLCPPRWCLVATPVCRRVGRFSGWVAARRGVPRTGVPIMAAAFWPFSRTSESAVGNGTA